MSSYLMANYKGKYTLQAEIDQRTGDFCRDKDGTLENYTDIWIDCQGKGKIFHFGKNVLEFYSNTLGRGRNILKYVYDGLIGSSEKFTTVKVLENGNEVKSFDFEAMLLELTKNGIIFDIVETSEEVFFKFKASNLEKLDPIIKPRTSTPNRSPFSACNRRKQANKNSDKSVEKYVLSKEKLADYKAISDQISKDDISVYNKINKGYLAVLSKKMRKPVDTLKVEQKQLNLKFKEYMSWLGDSVWEKYLEYMRNYLKENA